MPVNAIKKPPVAWPIIEAVRNVAELIAAACGSISFETIWAIIEPKLGPEKALIAPVKAITKRISPAIVNLFNSEAIAVDDKMANNNMHNTKSIIARNKVRRFSCLSIKWPAGNANIKAGINSDRPAKPSASLLLVSW